MGSICSSPQATVTYKHNKKEVQVPLKTLISVQAVIRVMLARNKFRARKLIKEMAVETYFPQTEISLLERKEYVKILELEDSGKIKWVKNWTKITLPGTDSAVIYRGFWNKKTNTMSTLGEVMFQDGTNYRGEIIK
jgi:hypothetical protein